jgi:hypothetical protein
VASNETTNESIEVISKATNATVLLPIPLIATGSGMGAFLGEASASASEGNAGQLISGFNQTEFNDQMNERNITVEHLYIPFSRYEFMAGMNVTL